MIVLERTETTADVRLTTDELTMLNNALNEICNGVHIEDPAFRTRLGWTREELRVLLKDVNVLSRRLRSA
jgi:hypothetical protein